uniref:Uncharacterized protein n=1 Tax=Moniliophthora roreri TaxID=221103 RepID=A0A0W0GCE5_MONRR
MPEECELYCSKVTTQDAIRQAQKDTGLNEFHVKALYADHTDAEGTKMGPNSLQGQGYTIELDHYCTYQCGTKGHQQSLYPPQYQLPVSSKHVNSQQVSINPVSQLVLCGPDVISATSRALIIDFDNLVLHVCVFSYSFLFL